MTFSTPGIASAAALSTDCTLPPIIGHRRTAANTILGKRTSRPKVALPLLLAHKSVRGAGLPISVQSLRALGLTVPGFSLAAAAANCPKWPSLPEAWLIFPCLNTSSPTGNCHCAAAACAKLARALAAARRTGSQASATLDEPPVMIRPNSRPTLAVSHCAVLTVALRLPSSVCCGWNGKKASTAATLPYMASGPACSKRTLSKGMSSSSAASMASAVCTPWPISLRGIASATEPSSPILIQPFSPTWPCVGNMLSALPRRLRGGAMPQPTSSAPLAPKALNKIVRRFMLRSRWPLGLRYHLRS